MDEIIAFASAREWERWLAKNHSSSTGIWMRMFRKHYSGRYIKGHEALDAALCYGWITGQARPYDGDSNLWRFCPRRPKSIWSKINTMHAERLIREGRMKPAGLRQIEEAKRDGRWDRAYSPQKTAIVPKDFLKALNKSGKAKEFFNTLNRSNRYAIIFRLDTTADAAKRKEKIGKIIKMLEQGRAYH
jgi:uncharacterized protein YdeI (YjbR/CyaY-like superfamily)